jgi:hypothetical protein
MGGGAGLVGACLVVGRDASGEVRGCCAARTGGSAAAVTTRTVPTTESSHFLAARMARTFRSADSYRMLRSLRAVILTVFSDYSSHDEMVAAARQSSAQCGAAVAAGSASRARGRGWDRRDLRTRVPCHTKRNPSVAFHCSDDSVDAGGSCGRVHLFVGRHMTAPVAAIGGMGYVMAKSEAESGHKSFQIGVAAARALCHV